MEEEYIKQISVIEVEVTFKERYFEKYDRIHFNEGDWVVISRPLETENGWKHIIKPISKEDYATYIPSKPLQLQELYEDEV